MAEESATELDRAVVSSPPTVEGSLTDGEGETVQLEGETVQLEDEVSDGAGSDYECEPCAPEIVVEAPAEAGVESVQGDALCGSEAVETSEWSEA